MRVAVVADDLYPGFGGQAVVTEAHAEALLELGHGITALGAAAGKPVPPPPGVVLHRLPVWRPGGKQTQFALPSRARISALLDGADVVQVNSPTPLGLRTLRLARRAGVPSVVGFHTQEESLTLHLPGYAAQPVGMALRGWYRYFYGLPDCLTAPTPFAARLVRGYTRRPVHVVSNGIRPPERENGEKSTALRERLLSGGRFLAAYVGRLAYEKRPAGLLDLLSAVKARRDDVRLAVAGTGPLRGELEHRAESLGLKDDVRFLGYVSEDEKQDLLEASDLFFMPSPTELQSIATLEAMARRCAVLALDASSSAVGELVRATDCGLVYRVGREKTAATEISGLLDRPAELRRLQENARIAAGEHDVLESGRRLEEIYTSLMHARPEGRHITAKARS